MSDHKIVGIYKPPRVSSYQMVRQFKRTLPPKTKIGHFGTLDPFASGLLLVGIGKATRLNNLVHDFLPKTYLAVGKLGVQTASGDHTNSILGKDDSDFFHQRLPQFSVEFINQQLAQKFLGDYWQVPPAYSACKFQGKALHRWAREDGIEIVKDPVLRKIFQLQVVKYRFPYLSIRFVVSSGTYIRSLFSDCAQFLGTYGMLLGLVREKIGQCHWHQLGPVAPEVLLPFDEGILPDYRLPAFARGLSSRADCISVRPQFQFQGTSLLAGPYRWLRNESGQLIALAQLQMSESEQQDKGCEWQTVVNFL